MYVILILVIILSAYAYFMPYKSRIANATEVVVLLNLVIILLLSTTPLVRESFGALTEVNPGNWLLYILYYLPIVLLFALGISLTTHILLRWLYYNFINSPTYNYMIISMFDSPLHFQGHSEEGERKPWRRAYYSHGQSNIGKGRHILQEHFLFTSYNERHRRRGSRDGSGTKYQLIKRW